MSRSLERFVESSLRRWARFATRWLTVLASCAINCRGKAIIRHVAQKSTPRRLCRSTEVALAIRPTSSCGAWTAPCVPVESRRAKRISDGRQWTNLSPLFPRSLFINYYKILFSAWSKQRSRRKLFIKSRDVISQMLVERFRPRTTR